MQTKFILGCNYWASHAGTEMWKNWNADVVENDFKVLREIGVKYLRVFPVWRDFQPVMGMYSGGGALYEYRLEGEVFPQNPYFLDEIMLERFHQFCLLAKKYELKLIVGLLTGWMSGRLLIPAVLANRNLFTDPVALMFEQKFIQGFVTRLKGEEAISHWDLGNECNCMSGTNKREDAFSWSMIVSNCIRANDNTRPIVSGMHSLGFETVWNIVDQAEISDLLTTHPYPHWTPHWSL